MKNLKYLLFVLFVFAFTVKVDAAGTEDLKIIFIGDSYCTANNIDNNGGEYNENQGWAKRTADKLKLKKYYISCRSGTGFIEPEGTETFFTLLDKAYTSSGIASGDVDLVVIGGGWNDHKAIEDSAAGTQRLTNEIDRFLDLTKSYFPNAKIVLAAMSWKWADNDEDRQFNAKVENRVIPAFREAADHKGVRYTESPRNAIKDHYEMFSNDKLHPNAHGQDELAKAMSGLIASNYNSGTYSCKYKIGDIEVEFIKKEKVGILSYEFKSYYNEGIKECSIEDNLQDTNCGLNVTTNVKVLGGTASEIFGVSNQCLDAKRVYMCKPIFQNRDPYVISIDENMDCGPTGGGTITHLDEHPNPTGGLGSGGGTGGDTDPLKIDDSDMTCGDILGKTGRKVVKGAITAFQIIAAIIAIVKASTMLIPAVAAKDAEQIKKMTPQLVMLAIVLVLILIFRPIVILLGRMLEFDVSCIL